MGRFFSSLRSRLILMVVLTTIPGILLLVQTGIDQRNQAMRAAQEEVIHLGQLASKMQAVMVENVKAFLLTLAHLPTLREQNISGCEDLFSHLVEEHFDYYSSFYVANLQGDIVCSPPGKHVPTDFATCEHYQSLLDATDFEISGYHMCRETGKAVLSIGYPIVDMQGKLVLVTNVSLDLVWFNDFAKDAELPPGSELLMLDEKGTILSHFPNNDQWRGKALPEATILSTLFNQKQGVLVGPGLDGREGVFAISPLSDTMDTIFVILGRPTSVAFAQANTTMTRNLVILLAVMAGMIALMWIIGDVLVVKNAKTLVQATRRLAQGDLTARSGMKYSQGEFGQLAQAFDGMADELAAREAERDRNVATLSEYARNLEHTNQELRDFTSIASHDLQEPLRKIQTFGELLQQRSGPNLDERGNDYIQRMQRAAERMQTLISDLLAYSRITAHVRPFTRLDLNLVVKQVLADLDLQIEQTRAVVQVGDLPEIDADQFQMNQLFQNLVGNALKFHKQGCPPVVRIFSEHAQEPSLQNGLCEIHIEDEGVGFNEKYLERIFQPFQRLHSREKFEGTGMGLTICRKIVDRHGGSITAHSTAGKGTTFIIRLPVEQKGERPGVA